MIGNFEPVIIFMKIDHLGECRDNLLYLCMERSRSYTQRAQSSIRKVACYKPYRFPKHELYNFCQVLTVWQLLVLHAHYNM